VSIKTEVQVKLREYIIICTFKIAAEHLLHFNFKLNIHKKNVRKHCRYLGFIFEEFFEIKILSTTTHCCPIPRYLSQIFLLSKFFFVGKNDSEEVMCELKALDKFHREI
jgi:hypothetical protein